MIRFLAVVLRTLKNRDAREYLISTTDIPVDEPGVRNAFSQKLGRGSLSRQFWKLIS